jgi:hypothetical protein
MNKRIPIYLVLLPTGLKTKEGVDLTILIGQKLKRVDADALAGQTLGAYVEKVFADK